MAVILERFVYFYVEYPIIIGMFLIISGMLLKRDRALLQRKLIVLALSIISLGLMVAMISGIFTGSQFLLIINFLCKASILFCSIGILVFCMFLFSTFSQIETLKEVPHIKFLILIIAYLSGMFFIPEGLNVPISPEGIQGFPEYSLAFFMYILIPHLVFFIYGIIYGIKIIKQHETRILKYKASIFLYAILLIFYMLLSTTLDGYLYTLSGYDGSILEVFRQYIPYPLVIIGMIGLIGFRLTF